MSQIIRVRNVNHALTDGLWALKSNHILEDSRNGPVMVHPGLVVTEYERPQERVLFNPVRDANPVFHLLESLWMLAGRADVGSLLPFNKSMATYAEDDGVLYGAYGHRWRRHYMSDQLPELIELLKREPNTRRAVLAMWDADTDLNTVANDIPCNTHVYFDLRGGVLNMTVCCRSNDIVWGAYGANAVHFSILQEFMACALRVELGVYRQVSNNFHVYVNNPQVQALLHQPYSLEDHYSSNTPPAMVKLVQPSEAWEDFLMDCEALFDKGRVEGHSFSTYFINKVAYPLMNAYLDRKDGLPIQWAMIEDCDWKRAFGQWVDRRVSAEITRAEGGAA